MQELSRRGLFESVEFFCDAQFRRTDLSDAVKYALASELVRSRTRQMLGESSSKRTGIKAKLAELAKEFSGKPTRDNDDALARIAFEFQLAIADFTLGDWQRLETSVAPDGERDDAVKRARTTLYDAIEAFKHCDDLVNALRRQVGTGGDKDFEQRSLALLRSIRFQWGLTQMALARSFPPGDDRTFGLNKAVEILSEIASLRIDDDTVFRSRIESIAAYRLLGDLEKCREALNRLASSSLPVDLQFQAAAELIRYHLAAGQPDEAFRIAQEGRNDSERYPDYDLARLETLLVLNRRINESLAGRTDEAALRQRDESVIGIVDLLRRIESRSGDYWGRRARMILGDANVGGPERIDPKLLRLLAEDQYQRGRFVEAVRLFDQASRAAEKSGDPENAFQNALAAIAVLNGVLDRTETSATVTPEERADGRQRLIDALRDLSLRYPNRPESAELHLKAIDTAAGSVLQKRHSLDDYIKLLEEHARHWPESRKVPPLLLRAALLLEQQGQTTEALGALQRIPNSAPIGIDVVKAAERCFAASDNVGPEQIATWFENRLPADSQPWNDADLLCAVRAAEHFVKSFSLEKDGSKAVVSAQKAEKVLRAALKNRPDMPVAENAQIQAMLVMTLSAQDRKEEGAAILQTLNADQLAKLLPEEKRTFQRVQAKLLAETGKTQDAVNLLADLLKQNPKDLSVWELLADILSIQSDPTALEKALRIRNDIESKATKGGELWWNAREGKIDLLLKQGKIEDAKQSFEVLRLLYPDLGGEARKNRLEKRFR